MEDVGVNGVEVGAFMADDYERLVPIDQVVLAKSIESSATAE